MNRCGWCRGEGAIRDADGRLGEDCPRCGGRTKLGGEMWRASDAGPGGTLSEPVMPMRVPTPRGEVIRLRPECSYEGCAIERPHYHRDTGDGEEVVYHAKSIVAHVCSEQMRCGRCLDEQGEPVRPESEDRFSEVTRGIDGGVGISVKDGAKFHQRAVWMNTRTKETFIVDTAAPMSVLLYHPVGPMEAGDELVLCGVIHPNDPIPDRVVPMPLPGT